MIDDDPIRCPDCGSRWVEQSGFSEIVWECRHCSSLFRPEAPGTASVDRED